VSITLAAVTTQFLERQGLAKSTLRSYEVTLMPLLQLYGRWPVEILDRPTLEEYLNTLTHLSYTTHRRHQSILQSLFNFALEAGYLKSNPIARLRQRKPDPDKGEHSTDQVIRYITPDQLQILYQVAASDYRMNALIHLLHRCGARISERVGLMGIEELRALMGHENIQTTLRYQKVTSSRAEKVAHKVLDILLSPQD
jgi:integrase/recombinase XerD